MFEILVAEATYSDVLFTGIIGLFVGIMLGYIICSAVRVKDIQKLKMKIRGLENVKREDRK